MSIRNTNECTGGCGTYIFSSAGTHPYCGSYIKKRKQMPQSKAKCFSKHEQDEGEEEYHGRSSTSLLTRPPDLILASALFQTTENSRTQISAVSTTFNNTPMKMKIKERILWRPWFRMGSRTSEARASHSDITNPWRSVLPRSRSFVRSPTISLNSESVSREGSYKVLGCRSRWEDALFPLVDFLPQSFAY